MEAMQQSKSRNSEILVKMLTDLIFFNNRKNNNIHLRIEEHRLWIFGRIINLTEVLSEL